MIVNLFLTLVNKGVATMLSAASAGPAGPRLR